MVIFDHKNRIFKKSSKDVSNRSKTMPNGLKQFKMGLNMFYKHVKGQKIDFFRFFQKCSKIVKNGPKMVKNSPKMLYSATELSAASAVSTAVVRVAPG